MMFRLFGVAAMFAVAAGQSTCADKTGATGGAVTDAECAAQGGYTATVGATTACAGDPCDMTVGADLAACCTADVDCVETGNTAADCLDTCAVAAATVTTAAAGSGTACAGDYTCVAGDGACPADVDCVETW